MSKLDKERQGKVNTILSEIEGIQLELDIQNWDVLLAGQLFFSDFPELTSNGLENRYQNLSNSVFLRLKWSF